MGQVDAERSLAMSTFVTSDGVRLLYSRRGVGPRVYVCHGGPANDHRYIAEDLQPMERDLEFVFHDYRGSGRSANAAHSTYTLDRFAADLNELREHVGDKQITVLGHSMGGFVALAYALQFPDRCNRLILAGTWPTNVPREMLPPTLRALGPRRFAKLIGRACWWPIAYGWRHRSPEARRGAYGIWSTMQEGLPDIRSAEAARERRFGLPLDNDNVGPVQRRFPTWRVTDQLAQVTCPALIIYGSRDAAAVAGAATFTTHMPNTVTCRLPEIGHDPFFEDPAATRTAVTSFLHESH